MFRLLLIATLLFGLVVTTPVLCVCDPAEHAGQAVHSLLPHTHHHPDAAPHAHRRPGDASHAREDGDPSAADARAPGDRAPAVAAQTGSGAASLATVGAVGLALASPWQIVPAVGGRRVPPALLVPVGEARPPLGPPPRQPAR